MIKTKLGEAVQWREGEAFHTGRVLLFDAPGDRHLHDQEVYVEVYVSGPGLIAVMRDCGGGVVLVYAHKLSPYPATEIPQP